MTFAKRIFDRFRSEQRPAQPELPPQPETVTLAYHNSAIAILAARLTAARAEAEANKVDAERYRAKLKRDRDYHAERRVQVKAEVA